MTEVDTTEYEYRVMVRSRRRLTEQSYLVRIGQAKPGIGDWSDWQVLRTGRGGGRLYRTLGAAKGVATMESSSGYGAEFECKIQCRPVSTEWHDVVA